MQYENEARKFKNLNKLYTMDEKIFDEKKEKLYQMEFELQKSEMKLDRLKGYEHDKSEAERKQKKIEAAEYLK